MNHYRFTRAPRSVRQVRRDNLALVSGDFLSQKAIYQKIANTLPRGAVLVVLPVNNSVQKRAMLDVAKQMSQQGIQVSVVPSTPTGKSGWHGSAMPIPATRSRIFVRRWVSSERSSTASISRNPLGSRGDCQFPAA